MPRYEYKIVPAPAKGLKGKGVKGAEARFAHALEQLMNEMANDGWEYQRAETLPSIERAGLTGSTTEWRNVLVFRRLRESDAEAFAPELLPPPAAPVVKTPQADSAPVEQPAEPPVKKPAEAPAPAATQAPDAAEKTVSKDPLKDTLNAVRNAAKTDS